MLIVSGTISYQVSLHFPGTLLVYNNGAHVLPVGKVIAGLAKTKSNGRCLFYRYCMIVDLAAMKPLRQGWKMAPKKT